MKLSDHLRAISIVRSPPDMLAQLLLSRFRGYGDVTQANVAGWEEATRFLVPLLSMDSRYLLVPFQTWTFLFDNSVVGRPGAQTVYLTQGARTVGVDACWRVDGRMWEVTENGQTARAIVSYEDGDRWVFHQEGQPLPFEDAADYAQPRKRERFPIAVVQKYVESMTSLKFPVDWRSVFDARAIGFERRSAKARVPIKEFPTEIDI